jgi:hypothetical protein
MLVSCDATTLSPSELALLLNPRMLAIVNDPLALQAKRLRTMAGVPAAAATRLGFTSCPPPGVAPLARQTWSFRGATVTSLESKYVRSQVLFCALSVF